MAPWWKRWGQKANVQHRPETESTEHRPTLQRSWSHSVREWSQPDSTINQIEQETGPSNDAMGWTSWPQQAHVESQPESSSDQHASYAYPSNSANVRSVDLTLIPNICNREDSSLFDGAIGNNNSDADDADFEHAQDGDEDHDEGNDVSEDIVPPIPEFGDAQWVDNATCSDWAQNRKVTTSSGIYLHQTFATKYKVIQTVSSWHLENNLRFKVARSNPTLVVLKCVNGDTCNWYFRAMYQNSTNMIKVTKLIREHTCTNTSLNRDHRQLTADFIAELVLPIIKADLKLNIAAVQKIVKARYQFTISYRKAWCAKQKVMERLFGSFEESYHMLPSFFKAMQQSNPGSIVHWAHKAEFNDFAIFGSIFWAFKPSIDEFQYCRPLISIDGTHLYGKYKGKLLVAVAYDANNGLFPLCFAIANEESSASWSWFLACIRHFVTNRPDMCIISDRHQGIKHAIADQWPNAQHRYCSRHMASNIMDRSNIAMSTTMCR